MSLRRCILLLFPFLFGSINLQAQSLAPWPIQNRKLAIRTVGGPHVLWQLRSREGKSVYSFAPPILPIGSTPWIASVDRFEADSPVVEHGGIREYSVRGSLRGHSGFTLRLTFRLGKDESVVRFQYTVEASTPDSAASFSAGPLQYLRIAVSSRSQIHEVQLSQFVALTHSYTLQETTQPFSSFRQQSGVMGPIVTIDRGTNHLLLAYEHGSTVPEAFLQFRAVDDTIALESAKPNTLPGQRIDAGHPWRSVWMESGVTTGSGDALASTYRSFVLHGMSTRTETRRPYLFYNTWNYQERQRWSPAAKDYLDSISLQRALAEVEVAHQLGIEVYVLDAGWFRAAGDWEVSPERFPDGLQPLRHKLEGYNMRLGLWFGPTSASVSSQVVQQHPEWRSSHSGIIDAPESVWGTEPAYQMCMVSGYSRAFAERVIHVAQSTGATYFKWDAVGQHQCNDPHHDHGDAQNTPEERDNAYAFRLVEHMTDAAARIADAIPGAIVDMDMTESGRAMGLSFLSEGKYFLVNNGPYFGDFDHFVDSSKANPNLFFNPGQSRTWILRSSLAVDRWIPSTLFLAHYFPDDPAAQQELNVGSLILGHDGLWGDLLTISPAGVDLIARLLAEFKQVRDDMTEVSAVATGAVSGSPEVYEKIAPSGRGAVVVFATVPGTYEYVTQRAVNGAHAGSEGVEIRPLATGAAHVVCHFHQPGAKIVYFGATEPGRRLRQPS